MIPNIAPPTPNVAKLMQFGNYPVNHFTGLANISIPLYEIKAGDITIPINLNYHTSGIKVTEHSGWVGLGWSLEPGGSISRTVMGMADAILDRIVYSSHRLELKGESFRKRKSRKKEEND